MSIRTIKTPERQRSSFPERFTDGFDWPNRAGRVPCFEIR